MNDLLTKPPFVGAGKLTFVGPGAVTLSQPKKIKQTAPEIVWIKAGAR